MLKRDHLDLVEVREDQEASVVGMKIQEEILDTRPPIVVYRGSVETRFMLGNQVACFFV